MKRTAILAAALLLTTPLAPVFAAEDTRYGLDAEFMHDTNATRGPGGADSQSDNVLAVEGSATRSLLLGPNSGAVFRGAARYSRYTDFSDISVLALGGRAAWRYQRDRAFGAPWFELAGEAQLLSHADSDVRDGNLLAFSASIGSYLTDRVRVSGGLGVDKRSGDDTGLYDLSTNRFWGTFDYKVGVRNAFYARLTRVAGDHVFNAGPGPNQGLLSLVSDRIIADPALGAGFLGYRIEATTWLYDLGYNLPLQKGHTLDFSLTYYSSETDNGGYKYDGAQLRASYLYRFQ
jgi:hypothetical protein